MDSNNPDSGMTASAPQIGRLDSPIDLLKFGFSIVTNHWKSIGMIVLLPIIITSIGRFLFFVGGVTDFVLNILFGIIGTILILASVPAAAHAVHQITTNPGIPLSIKTEYRFGFSVFWSFVLVAIIVELVNIGSLVLLVIPGIAVSIYITFYLYALVIDGKKGFEALTESFSLVRGHWWGVFGRFLFLGVLTFVISMILFGVQYLILLAFGLHMPMGIQAPSVGLAAIILIVNLVKMLIVGPLAAGYLYKLYLSLKSIRTTTETVKTFKNWLIAFLAIGSVVVVMIVVSLPLVVLSSISSVRSRANDARLQSEAMFRQIEQQMPVPDQATTDVQ